MGTKYDYDYIIIGSGPAGYNIAVALATAKKHVALIESASLGGSCLNVHDVPYSLSLDFANSYFNILSHPAVRNKSLSFNFPTLSAYIDERVQDLVGTFATTLSEAGATVIHGEAHFLDSHTIAAGDTKYTASRFVIATGAHPKLSEISGLDHVDHLTPSSAFRIRRLPEFAVIAGGGPTGVEIATYYAELGVRTLILERGSRLLPHEDKEISEAVASHLEKTLGATIITSAKLVSLDRDLSSNIAIFATHGQEKMVRADRIVLATGSEPSLDLGLENAGVKYKRTGILVDKYYQTSAENIYAIGDAISTASSSTIHVNAEAHLLAAILLHKTKSTADSCIASRFITTNPPVAVVGLNDRDILARDIRCRRRIIAMSSLTGDYTDSGFIKIAASPTGRILGASLYGQSAIPLSRAFTLAITNNLPLSDLISTLAPF